MRVIKKETEALLQQAMEFCDKNDKSTGFMIQYMQDYANVSHETVMAFLNKQDK